MSDGRMVHGMNMMVCRGMDVFALSLHPLVKIIMHKKNNFIHG